MGILSDFFLADADSVLDYQGGDGVSEDDKCQFKNLTVLQAGQFLAALRGTGYTVELLDEFKSVSPDDAEEWTVSVPQDMVVALASISDDDVAKVAEQFSVVTMAEFGGTPEGFVPIVEQLSALAKRALSTNQKMYLWNSL